MEQRSQSFWGPKVFSWTAHDYHPHERGNLWLILFTVIFFGLAIWTFFSGIAGGKLSSFTLLLAFVVYLFVHREGHKDHEVALFQKGFLIDEKKYISWEEISGYWFLYDESVSVINFEFKNSKKQKISLQMGNLSKPEFEKRLSEVGVVYLADQKESTMDLWSRVFKL